MEKIAKDELAFESDSEYSIIKTEDYILNRGVEIKEERLSLNSNRGYSQKGRTKINLLNNSYTKEYNILKDKITEIIDHLNLKGGFTYKNSNNRTINLLQERLREGYTLEDLKKVIDKKVKGWKGTRFEEYLTPFTLFGDKFEVYLNQKIIRGEENFRGSGNSFSEPKKLRFHNFEGREYDYEDLEKKLLGWS